jgi:hypothetical protein
MYSSALVEVRMNVMLGAAFWSGLESCASLRFRRFRRGMAEVLVM